MSTTERKPDRRIAATRAAIKGALLSLLLETPYRNINVTLLSKTAGITRATFYLHYEELDAVLDEVIAEAIRFARPRPSDPHTDLMALLEDLEAAAGDPTRLENLGALLPTCQRIADDPQYSALLKDPQLASYLADKLILVEKTRLVPLLMRQCDLAEREASVLFRLLFSGVFAVNQEMAWKKDAVWYEAQTAILRFLLGGCAALKKEDPAGTTAPDAPTNTNIENPFQ